MDFYHFRPSCKVIKRSRSIKSPILTNYAAEIIDDIFKFEKVVIRGGKLDLQRYGVSYNYSRKVFIGGLPSNITEENLIKIFSKFGDLVVDWPYKENTTDAMVPPKGFVFLLFKENVSVDYLLYNCKKKGDAYFTTISMGKYKNRMVQVRPWKLIGIDNFFIPLSQMNQRLTIFVGGVPRTLDAEQIGVIMSKLFGEVAYVGIDVDPVYFYPKGSARVIFLSRDSVVLAIKKRFVMPAEIKNCKMMEIKPYILDDQICDQCGNHNRDGKPTLFCSEPECLLYLCEFCWADTHSGVELPNVHKPMVKQGVEDYVNSLKKRGFNV